MKEQWKDIPEYTNYIVSDLGRVKNKKTNKTLSQQTHYKGYKTLKLSKNNVSKRYKIHRLVALAFIPNPLNKTQVNHINCIKDDNKLSNLEWVTNSENMKHAVLNGLRSIKLKKEDVLNIRKDNRKHKEIAKDYNISFQTVSEIKLKKTWKYV